MESVNRSREALFEILVAEHEAGLRAFVRAAVPDRAAAEDIVQDAFLAAWDNLDRYDTTRPFGAWLRGIARNHVLQYIRSRAAESRPIRTLSPAELDALAFEFGQLIPGRGDGVHDTLMALRSCIEKLGVFDRRVIDAIYRTGRTCREIADESGRSVEAVRKRLQRARADLRRCILERLSMEAVHG